jgi:hypothetical protein
VPFAQSFAAIDESGVRLLDKRLFFWNRRPVQGHSISEINTPRWQVGTYDGKVSPEDRVLAFGPSV